MVDYVKTPANLDPILSDLDTVQTERLRRLIDTIRRDRPGRLAVPAGDTRGGSGPWMIA